MRRAAPAAALLAALAASGCGVESGGNQGDRDAVNRFCESRGGGVLSTDWHDDTVVCADQHLYDAP